MFDDAFFPALEKVEAARSIDALQDAVRSLLRPYGLKHAVYHAIRIPGLEQENPCVIFTYPAEWIRHYEQKRYFTVDPVVVEARSAILPIDWRRVDKSARLVRKVFAEAYDAGLGRQGLTIPIRGARGELAIFSINSDLPDNDWDHLAAPYVRDMQTLGIYIHTRVLAILGGEEAQVPVTLSRRERECLQWAAVGKTISGTAEELCLSERVVRGYLDSARHKLGCLTKGHALAKAAALGLIEVR